MINYNLPLGQEVFGGELDLNTGILTITHALIQSYAGETLPGEWMSDRDEYVVGSTPTIGAQVVYELATPATTQLTAQDIEVFLGDNAIWSDVDGSTTVEWYANIPRWAVPNTRKINGKELNTDIDLRMGDIVPIASKTFTGVIGTANTWAGATFFFGSIKPDTWTDLWSIKYRIKTYVPGKDGYNQIANVYISGSYDALRAYYSWNDVGPYYPAYYHELYRMKQAGFTNGYGHSLGVRFYSAYSPIDTNYKRTIVVDVYEVSGCTFSFYDSCLSYESIPGTGSTNYTGYSELNYTSNGLQETGDANDVNYQNRIYYTSIKAAAALYRYQFCLLTKDCKLLPINSVDNAPTNLTKTLTTESFNPFGDVYYYNATSAVSVNGNVGNGSLYRQVLADLRYSFNIGTGSYLTAREPVYLVAVPQSDGMAKLASTPLVQELPTTDDGLIYIYLGRAYEDSNPYRIDLSLDNPVYHYKNGAIQIWTNGFNGSYDSLTDKPTIPVALTDLQEDTTHRAVTDSQIAEWTAKSEFSGSYNDLTNKPTIPTTLAQLAEDSTHRLTTDAEKATWNAKYYKPTSGVPMSDLSDQVQTLLRSIGTETATFTDEIIIGDVRLKRYTTKRLMITDVES